jgi:hypothetical protein
MKTVAVEPATKNRIGCVPSERSSNGAMRRELILIAKIHSRARGEPPVVY